MTAKKSRFSTQNVFQVWNDEDGGRFEAGEDSDGLGLLSLRVFNKMGDSEYSIEINEGAEEMVIEALCNAWAVIKRKRDLKASEEK